MKQRFSYCPSFLVSFAASLWFGVLLCALATTPIRGMFEPSKYEELFISFAFYSGGTCVGLLFACRRFGYEKRSVDKINLLLALLITFITEHLVAVLLDFAVYIAAGTRDLVQALYFGTAEYYAFAVPDNLLHIALLCVQIGLFLPSVLGGIYLGVAKRKKEIKKLKEAK